MLYNDIIKNNLSVYIPIFIYYKNKNNILKTNLITFLILIVLAIFIF